MSGTRWPASNTELAREAGEEMGRDEFDPPLDPGIELFVRVLRREGVETFESCEGGDGHAFPEPTVRFHGHRDEGLRALAVALRADFPVSALRRIWDIFNGEPSGPHWEITFYRVEEKR